MKPQAHFVVLIVVLISKIILCKFFLIWSRFLWNQSLFPNSVWTFCLASLAGFSVLFASTWRYSTYYPAAVFSSPVGMKPKFAYLSSNSRFLAFPLTGLQVPNYFVYHWNRQCGSFTSSARTKRTSMLITFCVFVFNSLYLKQFFHPTT